jgi:BolA protein
MKIQGPSDVKRQIIQKLQNDFSPTFLEVIDESERHKGHQGYKEGHLTHVRVRISSKQLEKLSRITAHRLIYQALKTWIQEGLHAIAIEII